MRNKLSDVKFLFQEKGAFEPQISNVMLFCGDTVSSGISVQYSYSILGIIVF